MSFGFKKELFFVPLVFILKVCVSGFYLMFTNTGLDTATNTVALGLKLLWQLQKLWLDFT